MPSPRYLLILTVAAVAFSRCNEPLIPRFLNYYLEAESIVKVEMNNVNGKFILNEKQLTKFRTEFMNTRTVPDLSIKTGSLAMIITLSSGKTYVARGSSRSDFVEISSSIATLNTDELKNKKWLVLDTREANFNNYKPR